MVCRINWLWHRALKCISSLCICLACLAPERRMHQRQTLTCEIVTVASERCRQPCSVTYRGAFVLELHQLQLNCCNKAGVLAPNYWLIETNRLVADPFVVAVRLFLTKAALICPEVVLMTDECMLPAKPYPSSPVCRHPCPTAVANRCKLQQASLSSMPRRSPGMPVIPGNIRTLGPLRTPPTPPPHTTHTPLSEMAATSPTRHSWAIQTWRATARPPHPLPMPSIVPNPCPYRHSRRMERRSNTPSL